MQKEELGKGRWKVPLARLAMVSLGASKAIQKQQREKEKFFTLEVSPESCVSVYITLLPGSLWSSRLHWPWHFPPDPFPKDHPPPFPTFCILPEFFWRTSRAETSSIFFVEILLQPRPRLCPCGDWNQVRPSPGCQENHIDFTAEVTACWLASGFFLSIDGRIKRAQRKQK